VVRTGGQPKSGGSLVIVLRQLRRGLEAPQQDGAEIPSKGSRTNTLVPWRRSLRGPAPAIVASCGERRGLCTGLSCFGPFGAAEKRNFKSPERGRQRDHDWRCLIATRRSSGSRCSHLSPALGAQVSKAGGSLSISLSWG